MFLYGVYTTERVVLVQEVGFYMVCYPFTHTSVDAVVFLLTNPCNVSVVVSVYKYNVMF